jgi:hypothetical protein
MGQKKVWDIKINKVRQYNEVSERKKVGQWRYFGSAEGSQIKR